MGTGRLTLLLTTPRLAPGLLTRAAWVALEEAAEVLCADPLETQPDGIRQAGMPVTSLDGEPAAALARRLVERATDAQVVWVVGDDGDPGLTDAIAAEVSRIPEPPEVEVLVGSYDVPGARLLDLVAVMDRLRSPGGCPWDAEQTHASLVPYVLEEAYELAEAVETGDRPHLVEELGDVLLQVAFHARVGQEDADDPFDIDDVAGGIVAKLVRRHPHVFGDVSADTAAQVADNWEHIKAAEKSERTWVLDGIPAGLPALARADKVLGRLERAGLASAVGPAMTGGEVGPRLLALVAEARRAGVDAEAALREVLRSVEARAREEAGDEVLERASVRREDGVSD